MKVKKKKKSRLAVVFLCVAAVFALLWGGAELLRHLTHLSLIHISEPTRH